MSHFLAVLDPSPSKREACIGAARTELESLRLPLGGFNHGQLSAVWAAPATHPPQWCANPEGAALVLGRAHLDQTEVTATALPALWNNVPSAIPEPLAGLHAALCVREAGNTIAAADLLGRVPVYYWTADGSLMLGSSPELFRGHPGFRLRLDRLGLVHILTTNMLVDGRTLLHDVRRLGAGNLLHWNPQTGAREICQYRIPLTDDHFGASFEKQADLVESALDDAISRHMPRGPGYEILLSGGLDSRLLGGFLRRNDVNARAITWGRDRDIEMGCARQAARALGFPHSAFPLALERLPEYAALEAKWRAAANGFNGIMFWQRRPDEPAPGGFTSGHAMDIVIGGGVVITESLSKPGGRVTFERLLARDNAWGIPVPILKRLLRPERFDGLAEETLATLRRIYVNHGGRDFQNAWCHTIYHRHRFHTASVIGLHGFWGWPTLPAQDRKVLEVMASLPVESMAARKMERHLIQTRFPDLARLPLDRNSHKVSPLAPRFGPVADRLIYGAERGYLKASALLFGERRFYYRVMDFDGPGWRAIRREAEPGRKQLEELFHRDVLRELAPPPDLPLKAPNPLIGASGARLLVGLMLWARDRL